MKRSAPEFIFSHMKLSNGDEPVRARLVGHKQPLVKILFRDTALFSHSLNGLQRAAENGAGKTCYAGPALYVHVTSGDLARIHRWASEVVEQRRLEQIQHRAAVDSRPRPRLSALAERTLHPFERLTSALASAKVEL